MSFAPINRISNHASGDQHDGRATGRRATGRPTQAELVAVARREVLAWLELYGQVVRMSRMSLVPSACGHPGDDRATRATLDRACESEIRAVDAIRRACGLPSPTRKSASLVLADGRVATVLPGDGIVDEFGISHALVIADRAAGLDDRQPTIHV